MLEERLFEFDEVCGEFCWLSCMGRADLVEKELMDA